MVLRNLWEAWEIIIDGYLARILWPYEKKFDQEQKMLINQEITYHR